MEKYSASCRLVLCSNSSSKVTEAVRSRCLNVRINAPMEEEIVNVLEFIAKKEGLQSPQGFAARIAEKSNRNLRRAVLTFETCRVQQYPFTNNQAIPPMDWEQYVSEIASDIMKEQSPKRLFEVRGKLYELLTNCIPPEIILKRLLFELLKKLDSELKHEVSNWAAHYEHRMRLGQKAIFHLEGVGESSMKWIVNHESMKLVKNHEVSSPNPVEAEALSDFFLSVQLLVDGVTRHLSGIPYKFAPPARLVYVNSSWNVWKKIKLNTNGNVKSKLEMLLLDDFSDMIRGSG
ncbi:Replication factor C subunit 3 [Capsicum annuum]|nr:Replication factor C subunit 3 [Capsicum annuum]